MVLVIAGCGGPEGTASASYATNPAPRFNVKGDSGVGTPFSVFFGPGYGVGTLRATLTAFVDNGVATPPAPNGTRYVAADFTFVNQSPAAPAPVFDFLRGLRVITYDGVVSPALAGTRLASGSMLQAGPVTLQGGATLTGWAVFAIPTGQLAQDLDLKPQQIGGGLASWNVLPLASPPAT